MKLIFKTQRMRLRVYNLDGSVVIEEETRIKYAHGTRQWTWDRELEEVA